jgi:dienelactone hydrolase
MTYPHLGIFSDWVEEARKQGPLYPIATPGPETQARVREVLGFCNGPELPIDAKVEDRWEQDGLIGEEVTWWVGYGPRTHAWLFKPIDTVGALPGILALHDHGGFKYYGKEKIADGREPPEPFIVKFRDGYGGRAYANALAKEGFAVLVHDAFLWGSRKFPVETIPEEIRSLLPAAEHGWQMGDLAPQEVIDYNFLAAHHEHLVEKYCNLLGTTMAGMVSHEDRIALNYLISRPEVNTERIGCIGLSGGGNRAALLQATYDRLKAAVIVGLMSTYEGLLDRYIMPHTWMFFPHGWARYGDWPDLAACRAPSPLLVQYDLEDELFTVKGMQDAHKRLADHYQSVGHPEGYTGEFYPGPHKFDLEMQHSAFAWLKRWLYQE